MNESKNSNIPPAPVIEKMLALQEKDLILKTQQLDLQKQTDQHSFQYAKDALVENAKDRDAQRKYHKSILRESYFFASFIILIFFIFMAIALYFNKDDLAKEIVRAIIYLGSGGIGGYFWGKSKPKN